MNGVDASEKTSVRKRMGGWVLRNLSTVALFWILSDLAYYFVLPAIGYGADYNEFPVVSSLFYLFWTGLAAIYFSPLYMRWSEVSPWPVIFDRRAATLVWILMFAASVYYLRHLLPDMPDHAWTRVYSEPPDILVAAADYFLPKTVEIIFQQLLGSGPINPLEACLPA